MLFLFDGILLFYGNMVSAQSPGTTSDNSGVGPVIIKLPVFWYVDNLPVISIYKHNRTLDDLIVAIFPDGKMIWVDENEDQAMTLRERNERFDNGGPYYFASISQDRISSFILNLDNACIFEDPGSAPMSSLEKYHCIVVNTLNQRLFLQSSHENFEHNGRFWYGYNGEIFSRSEIDYNSFMQSQPDEYKIFRENWDILKKEIISLIPRNKSQIRRIIGMKYLIRKINALTQEKVLSSEEIDLPHPSRQDILDRLKDVQKDVKDGKRDSPSFDDLLRLSKQPVPTATPGTWGKGPVYFIDP
jgi:hypothetical protein